MPYCCQNLETIAENLLFAAVLIGALSVNCMYTLVSGRKEGLLIKDQCSPFIAHLRITWIWIHNDLQCHTYMTKS